MPVYLSPGVYFEEFVPDHLGLLPSVDRPRPQAARPIEAARSRWKDASSTAVLIGFTGSGPVDEPTFVRNWNQFESTFGPPIEGAFLARAVQGYFQNGGTGCFVIRSEWTGEGPPEYALGPSIARAADLADLADLVCVPDVMPLILRGDVDLAATSDLVLQLISTCEMAGLTAIVDSPPALLPQSVRDWRLHDEIDTWCAALYYPWIAVFDPLTDRSVFVPPSGHVAGMIARVADTAGLHRTPANQLLAGAMGVECALSRDEIGLLHPLGINAIVAATGDAPRVVSARTMSSDPEQRHLARRRVVNFVWSNLQQRMAWVLNEPSEPQLWEQIARDLDNLFALLFRAGVLAGAAPENAYVVRCDAGTNPLEVRAVRQVVAEIVANLADGSQLASRAVFFSG